MSQGVWAGRVLANGGRHARTEPYRGRHRKPGGHPALGAGTRITVTLACAALLAIVPRTGGADHASTGTARPAAAGVSRTALSHTAVSRTALGHAAVSRLSGPLRLLRSTRPA